MNRRGKRLCFPEHKVNKPGMDRFGTLLLLSLSPLFAAAQSPKGFVDRMQKDVAGWGKLTIVQEPRLTHLLNNDSTVAPKRKNPAAEARATREPSKQEHHPAAETGGGAAADSGVDEPRQQVRVRRYKISGYRVQIYAGSNSRSSRIEAEKAAQRFKGYFPHVPAYTHFYPPRWVCRVGDFKTAEEAQGFMHQIAQLKAFSGLIVVKTAIQVSYKSESEE